MTSDLWAESTWGWTGKHYPGTWSPEVRLNENPWGDQGKSPPFSRAQFPHLSKEKGHDSGKKGVSRLSEVGQAWGRGGNL